MTDPARQRAVARREVGRPHPHDDTVERALLVDAGYRALREHGADVTIAHILAAARLSTRSFYRHFESKDALLCAMYRQDVDDTVARLHTRVSAAAAPRDAVVLWVDEVFAVARNPRRAERVAVFRSVTVNHAAGIEAEAARARELLVAPLRAAVEACDAPGATPMVDPAVAAELVTVAALHAAALVPTNDGGPLDPDQVTAFCLRALGL